MKTLRFILTLPLSVALAAGVMTAIQSCSKDEQTGGNEDLIIEATMSYMKPTVIRLFCNTSIETLESKRYFLYDTLSVPTTKYDLCTGGKTDFHTIDINIEENRTYYYQAVVEKDGRKYTSKVESFTSLTLPRPEYVCTEYVRGQYAIIKGTLNPKPKDDDIKTVDIKFGNVKCQTFENVPVSDNTFEVKVKDAERGNWYYVGTFYNYMTDRVYSSSEVMILTDNEFTFSDPVLQDYAVRTFGSNGKITDRQAYMADGIDIRGLGVKTLEEIDMFPNIRFLYADNNPIEKLEIPDVFIGKKLDTVTCSSCDYLTEVYLSSRISYLDCHDSPKLTAINGKRREYTMAGNLHVDYANAYDLNCSGCHLTCNLGFRYEDDTSGESYRSLKCSHNNITFLGFFYTCDYLDCSHNKLTELNLKNKYGYSARIDTLDCSFNLLEALDISACDGSSKLDCSHNKLTELNLKNKYGYGVRIDTLDCSFNLLEALDISACDLNNLDCTNNPFLDTIYVDTYQLEHPDFIIKDEHTKLLLRDQ